MKLMKKQTHGAIYNFFNNSLSLDYNKIYNDTIMKILKYYTDLDYTKLTEKEYAFFQNTIFSKSFIKNLLSFKVSNTKIDEYGFQENLRELHIPHVSNKEELERKICTFFNIWLIKRLSYKLNINDYPFEKPDNIEFDYLNLENYIKIRKAIFILGKLGAGSKYTHSNIYEEYYNLYLEYPIRNIVNISSSLKKSEQYFLMQYADDISKRILKKF